MSELKLGQLIDTPQNRDAIHIAVAPVTAKEVLHAGQHVGLEKGNSLIADSRSVAVGIVDPFLKDRIHSGDRFWLFLYPQTVTGMRHEWNHPAFAVNPAPVALIAAIVPITSPSERWLRDYAERVDQSYETIMQYAAADAGDYICEGGRYEGEYVPKEFWEHYKNVTGKDGRGESFFTCSC